MPNIKTTLPITEARKKIYDIADEVQKPSKHFILTENGRPKAVILSAEEFESIIETIEVMRDFPELEKDIKEARKAVKSGEYKDWTSLDDLLAEEGYISREKAKKEYGVRSKTKAKGRKGSKKTSKKRAKKD